MRDCGPLLGKLRAMAGQNASCAGLLSVIAIACALTICDKIGSCWCHVFKLRKHTTEIK